MFVMIVVEVSEAVLSPHRDDIDLFVLRVSNYCKSDTTVFYKLGEQAFRLAHYL